MPPRHHALALALLAAAACGKSAEEKAVERFRAACLGFPEAGATLRTAVDTFADGAILVRCGPGEDSGAAETINRYDGDLCDHTGRVCDLGWCYLPNDPDLCGPFGCWYSCGVRVVQVGEEIPTDEAVICGSRFVDEQPTPSLCGF